MGTRSLALACALSTLLLCGCSMPRVQITFDGPEDTEPAEVEESEPESEDVSPGGWSEGACSTLGDAVEMEGFEVNVPERFELMESAEGHRQYYSSHGGMLEFNVTRSAGADFDGMTDDEVERVIEEATRASFPDDLEIRWVERTSECSGVSFTTTVAGGDGAKAVGTILHGNGRTASVIVAMLPDRYEYERYQAENIVDTLRPA